MSKPPKGMKGGDFFEDEPQATARSNEANTPYTVACGLPLNDCVERDVTPCYQLSVRKGEAGRSSLL